MVRHPAGRHCHHGTRAHRTGHAPLVPLDALVDDAGECIWTGWCHAVDIDDDERAFVRPKTRLYLEFDDGETIGGRWEAIFVDGTQLRGVVERGNGTGREVVADLASVQTVRLAGYRVMDADWAPTGRSSAHAALRSRSAAEHPHRRRNNALVATASVVGGAAVLWGILAAVVNSRI